MFHVSPHFWLDEQLLALVDPESFELRPDLDSSPVMLVDSDGSNKTLFHDASLLIPRNAAPSANRMRRRHPGIQFSVRAPSAPESVFSTFQEAASYAVDDAAKTGWKATLDVVALSRSGARWCGGNMGAAAFDKDPADEALERFVISVKRMGGITETRWVPS
jgi:hypothetical protein